MYLASGTDQVYMREEARLLDVARYFDGGVYGALDDYKSFSKKILIQRVIASAPSAAAMSSWASATATWRSKTSRKWAAWRWAWPPPSRSARPSTQWKRERLAGVGADFIVPNFLCHRELLAHAVSQWHEPWPVSTPCSTARGCVVKPLAERVTRSAAGPLAGAR